MEQNTVALTPDRFASEEDCRIACVPVGECAPHEWEEHCQTGISAQAAHGEVVAHI